MVCCECDCDPELLHPSPPRRSYDLKANLCARLPATDGNVSTGGIVLSGHTDVVPVDGQPWDTDPFDVTVKDDRLYGRGVTDMKSFSAIGRAFVPEDLARGLRRPHRGRAGRGWRRGWLAELPSEGYGLWFWPSANSLPATRPRGGAGGGVRVAPLSLDQRLVTVLKLPEPPASNSAPVR